MAATRPKRSSSARTAKSGAHDIDKDTATILEAQNAELARLLADIDAGLDEIDQLRGRTTRRAA